MRRIGILGAAIAAMALAATSCGGGDDSNFELAVQPIGSTGPNCTHPGWWWKRFNAYAANPADQIPWPVDENLGLCGDTILEWVTNQPAKGHVWHVLARQVIVAALNTHAGAIAPTEVHNALLPAKLMIATCSVATSDEAVAMQYYMTLDLFNRGLLGPSECP